MTILFVAIWSFIVGVGLSYLMLAGIIQAERRRGEGYPAIRNERPPIPICHPDRHNTLTGAYQEQMSMDERLVAELSSEVDELERYAHEYRMEIRRLRDELAELRTPAPVATVSTNLSTVVDIPLPTEVRFPAPVATVGRYNVIDRFAYLEVSE